MAAAPELFIDAEAPLTALQRSLDLPPGALTPDLLGDFGRLTEEAPALAGGALDVTLGFITGVAGVGIALVLAFYWPLERRGIEGTSQSLLPHGGRAEPRRIIAEVEAKLGGYVRGQLALAVIVGLLSLAGLLIVGMAELIPLAGPIIAALPAILVTLAVSPPKPLLVAGLYLVIQQVENYLLVPKVMQRAMDLSTVTIVFAVLAEATLGGIVGVLREVPMAAAASVVLRHIICGRQRLEGNTPPARKAGN